MHKRRAILPKFLLIFVTCAFHFSVLFLVPLFFLKSFTSTVVNSTLPVRSVAFPLFSVIVVLFTLLSGVD